MLMGKKVVLLRCLYLYEMLPMLLSPPMPLPLPSMSMDPALRLEPNKVFKVLGSDHLEQGLYPQMSILMEYYSYAFASPAPEGYGTNYRTPGRTIGM